jgi:hypothetical protein
MRTGGHIDSIGDIPYSGAPSSPVNGAVPVKAVAVIVPLETAGQDVAVLVALPCSGAGSNSFYHNYIAAYIICNSYCMKTGCQIGKSIR